MPYDSGGNFSLVPSYKATPGQTIRTEQHNPPLEDVASALSSVLVRDGRNGMVGVLNMGSFPITNVAASQTATSAATVGQVQGAMPIGAVIDYAGANAPEGWLLCYGQAVSRVTYAALFAVIGTTFGAGDGATTFNVPDCRGRVTAGRDNMGGTDAERLSFFGAVAKAVGGVLGAASHALTANQNGPHNHTGYTDEVADHVHAGSSPASGYVAAGGYPILGPATTTFNFTTSPAGRHRHFFTTGDSGSGEGHPNAQPTVIFNKIIKASY